MRRIKAPLSESIGQKRRVLLAMDVYLHQVHRGVVDYAQQAGWMLDARAHYQGQLPEGWSADGLITSIGSRDDLGPRLRSAGLPMVNMSPFRPELGIPSVQLDNRAIGAIAANHLIGHGFQHTAMIQFVPDSPTSDARRNGFESAIQAAQRSFYPMVCPHQPQKKVLKLQLDWLRTQIVKMPLPLGVFTEGDLWAVELIHICRELGLLVPDQIAIVGVDNDPFIVDVAPVPLSSVDTNLRGLGFRAAELLDQILSGSARPKVPILIPPLGMVQRQSTNILAVTDGDLSKAVRYIHEHFSEPITLEDVAQQTATTRRRLQDLFNRHFGRTIREEIQRCRLDLAKRLLQETSLKADAIAERTGFGNAVRMTKVFTRELGMGPGKYRLAHTYR